MKVEKITVSIGRTVNMGNYESFRIEETVTAYVEEGKETPSQLMDIVRDKLEDRVEADAKLLATRIRARK